MYKDPKERASIFEVQQLVQNGKIWKYGERAKEGKEK